MGLEYSSELLELVCLDVDARIVPLDAVKAVNEMKFMPLEAVKHSGVSYPLLKYVDWTSGPE